VRRDIYRKGEFDRWVATPRGVQGLVSRFGHLTFDDRLAPPRRIEVLPYITGRREQELGLKGDNDIAGGLDARIGVGTSSTLSATFNPDFGQVEQDPAVLNLTVFETFFPEKRPFFLEDSRVFVLQFPQFPLFHSRRIGQRPGRLYSTNVLSSDTLVSRPEQSTILAAGKFTGKKGPWTYGAVSALTSPEYAIVDASTTDLSGNARVERTERLIEPRTSYNVGRVQRDLFRGISNVGLIGTAVLRDQDVDAYTGGGDYSFRWKRNMYQFRGHWVGTHAPVSGEQRDGWGGASQFFYSGKHFNFNTHLDHFSRYFRNADLGFLGSRPNKTATNVFMGAGQPDPKKYLRSFWTFLGGGQEFNDDVVLNRFVNIGQDLQLPNFWYIGWNAGRNFDAMDDLDTRGGPPIVRPSSQYLNVFVNSDSRKTFRYGGNIGVARDRVQGSNDRIGFYLNLQPSSQLQLSFNGNYTQGRSDAQWVATKDADADGVTDYVYGSLTRDVLDVTTRATYSFTRNLTLQMFLQPFVAVGDYTNIRKLARERSYEFTPIAYSSNPDFNTKSLRTNTVLRWEYRPGSTLFVVWNRSGSDATRPGIFSAWQDFRGAFGAESSHVFMVKLNYWLGL
jgi:hypothetical protein